MSTLTEKDLRELSIAQVHDNPLQPRHSTSREIRDSVRAAIEANGGAFPAHLAITVRARAAGGFEIISGHHRANAAREAGLPVIWAHVVTMSDREAAIALLASNSQRPMAPLEVGRHALILRTMGVSIEETAKSIGKTAGSVYGYARAYQVVERFGGLKGLYGKTSHLVLSDLAGLDDDKLIGTALSQFKHRGVSDAVARETIVRLKAGVPLFLALETSEEAARPKPEHSPRMAQAQGHASAPRPFAQPGANAGVQNGPDAFGGVVAGALIQNNEALEASAFTVALFQARCEVLEKMFGHLIEHRSTFHDAVEARHRELLAARRNEATA
jgi:ParB/RepB/Spo0J family partition protein